MRYYKLAVLIFIIAGLMFSLGIAGDRTWTAPSALLSYDESTASGRIDLCSSGLYSWTIAGKNDLRSFVYCGIDSSSSSVVNIKIGNLNGGYSTFTMGIGMRPSVAMDSSDRAYYTWVSNDSSAGLMARLNKVYFAEYHNGGTINPTAVFQVPYGSSTMMISSVIASNNDGSKIYLFYTFCDTDTKVLYYSGSNDHGTTWNSPTTQQIFSMHEKQCGLSDVWVALGYHSSAVVDHNNIGHVAFTLGDNADGVYAPVFYCTVSSNGLVTNPILISDTSTTKCSSPTIAISTGANQQVYVAWNQYIQNSSITIFCKNVTTNSLVTVSNSTHDNVAKGGPSMTVDRDGKVHIVWHEWSSDSNQGIYYSNNFNTGFAIQTSQKYISAASICCDNSSRLHLMYINGDNYTPYNVYYMKTSSNWENSMGDFSADIDYSSFAYESMESLPVSTTSWDTTFQGRSCLKIAYSSLSSGVKITAFSKFTTSSADQWYRLRLVYYRDTSCSLLNLTPTLVLYDTPSTYNIKQIGGSFTGESRILPGNWIQFDSYVKCKNTVGQIQIKAKNNGTSGNVYIDTIDFTPAIPPAIDSTVNVTISQGDFNVAADTTGWAFQPGSSSNAPTVFWDSSNQRLGLTFSNQSQTMKMTCLNSYNIVTGRNAVMSFTVYVSKPGSQTNDVHCYGYLYADGYNWPYDIGTNAIVSDLPTNQTYTMTASLSSQNNVTNVRLPQILLKNNSDSNITIYIDDIQLKYATY